MTPILYLGMGKDIELSMTTVIGIIDYCGECWKSQ